MFNNIWTTHMCLEMRSELARDEYYFNTLFYIAKLGDRLHVF